jgi:proteic killer suppression protein
VKRYSGIEKQALRNSTCCIRRVILATCARLQRTGSKGDRRGQHSIRINDQWRVCFTWTTEGPANVEIVDYH